MEIHKEEVAVIKDKEVKDIGLEIHEEELTVVKDKEVKDKEKEIEEGSNDVTTPSPAMDVHCHDERAAGVLAGADPYKELELYLQKVNEEIGEVFDRWKTETPKATPTPRIIPLPPTRKSIPSASPLFNDSVKTNGHHLHGVRRRLSEEKQRQPKDFGLSEWSETLLSEFNSIIAKELSAFQTDAKDADQDEQDEVFLNGDEHVDDDMMRIKGYRTRSWDNYNVNDTVTAAQTRGTSPPSPATSSTSDTSSGSSTAVHARPSGLSRVLQRKHRANGPSVLPPGEPAAGAAVLVRVSSLPDADIHREHATEDLLPVPRTRNAHSFSETTSHKANANATGDFVVGASVKCKEGEAIAPGDKVPAKFVVNVRESENFNSASLPKGMSLNSAALSCKVPVKVVKNDDDDSKSSSKPGGISSKMFNGVTTKGSLPFSNITLPESHASSLHETHASSLPESHASSLPITHASSLPESHASSLPVQIPVLTRECRDQGIEVNTESAVIDEDGVDGATSGKQDASPRRNEGRSPLPAALHNFLTKMRPRRGRGRSPSDTPRSFSPGPPTSTLGAAGHQPEGTLCPIDAGTQTSPGMSRSSSFTWVSDCSSLLLHSPDSDTLDDDNRSSSSSSSSASPKDFEDYVSSMESPGSLRNTEDFGCDFSSRDSLLSSSPPGSGESPERDEEPESGIGTASPPRNKSAGVGSKARRKETWERLRKRPLGRPPRGPSFKDQEVWIRRENVETQTSTGENGDSRSLDETSNEDLRPADSSSGLDDTTTTTPDGLDSDISGGANSLPMPRPRAVRPQCLAVTPQHLRLTPSPNTTLDESYQDHPSPSTASLKLNTTPLPTELGNKSSSAPLLVKKPAAFGGIGEKKGDGQHKKRNTTQPRSQSERHLAEIEAGEACKWLRAAGFPQYAQMYEDLQFPIDVSGVQKDHPFLDPDSLQSLYRRLSALNRCAKMKVEHLAKKSVDDSDEDDNCALSENWTFQPESRRWSRVCDVTAQHAEKMHAISAPSHAAHEPDLDEEEDSGELDDIPVINPLRYGSLPPGNPAAGDADLMAVRFRRTGSERLRDGAKALLRRMESLKSRRRKRLHRENVIISGPQVLDVLSMNQRMKDMNCVDVSPDGVAPPFPGGSPPFADDSCSDGSVSSTPQHRRSTRRRRDEPGAMSDPESQPPSWRHQYLKDANSNHTKVVEFIDGRSRGSKDQEPVRPSRGQTRTGSLNLGRDSQRFREKYHQHSLRREPTSHRDKYNDDSKCSLPSQVESDLEDSEVTPRHKASVVRWHSFQRGSSRPDSYLFRLSDGPAGSSPMGSLSCGQLLVLRKLALLKLTACMERYCPTHRTGWNWELPKFIRKIKAPDYKDKTVFGVPLLVSLQRNGQALPKCIQMALRWLRLNALDQVGLFRKSGVRSRIQKLKTMTESQGDSISYEGQQAYDVADMVKQYFRELPEALLTNKLSETFIAIFQHVPTPLRHDAVQCVLLLLPDEHREALQTLVEFLHQVSAQSALNQMTASNLAVCLAPSLFHLHHAPGGARSSSASPRRKTVGAPDPRELGENRAAHDCLLYLVKEHKDLFMVGEDMLNQCHFSYMEQSIPVALEELGAEFQQDWRGYLYACTTALLKEAREKSRGWVSVACTADPQVDMCYRKVGDGHPLRLWRVSTEVEAPPRELLQRVLRERHVWDHSLLKWRVVQQLDQQVEVFQYVCANMAPSPAKDFCVLRSWRSDLPKGACVIVETSVEHADGAVMLGGVRGIVLASRYLIEPCGSGRSRIMHLSRVDTKGRTPDWYNKSYGHICALHLSRIRSSFKHSADGPESKV